MQAFEYKVASSLDQAIEYLSERPGQARPLAGGTDLLVQLRTGRHQIERLVDLKGIPELQNLEFDAHRGLVIGAAVPCYKIYGNPRTQQDYPGLADATSLIGGTQIQSRASLGGNLCNAAPSGDTIPPLITLGAICSVVGPNGTREIPVEEFCTGPGQTIMHPQEILVSICLPPPKPNSGSAYLRFIPRNEMDIAVAGAAASVILEPDGSKFVSGSVALASVGPTPILVNETKSLLQNQDISDATIQMVARAARVVSRPITDMRGSTEYRRHLVGVLTHRVIKMAIERARRG